MKLIIAGASGFVGKELVNQSLKSPEITSVVALARKPVAAPKNLGEGTDVSKFKSLVIKDYDTYSDEVKKEFAGADACIWTVAITPTKSKTFPFEEVKRVCQSCTMASLQAMYEAGPTKPFRFLYMSGLAAERDQTKTPNWMPQYCLMRGETENLLLKFASNHPDEVEACVAKPGLITEPRSIMKIVTATTLKWTIGLPNISVQDISVAMLNQALQGFEKETLMNNDLVEIAARVQKNKQ